MVLAKAVDDAARRDGCAHRRFDPCRHGQPDGNEFPNPGVFLEVIPGQKIVFTDAYTQAWKPSEKPFMTVVLTFEDEGDGKTRYIARVRHWSVADREQHEAMGFHQGWGQCADQLEDLARTL